MTSATFNISEFLFLINGTTMIIYHTARMLFICQEIMLGAFEPEAKQDRKGMVA